MEVEHQATMSNSNEVALELLWVELSYVGFWQLLICLDNEYEKPQDNEWKDSK